MKTRVASGRVRRPTGKYQIPQLIRMFRLAAKLRNEMIAANFTDNGGAIHSAERILNILGQRLNYPGLSHIAHLRHHKDAEFSKAARAAFRRGELVYIEHVAPLRALTCLAIEKCKSESNAPLIRLLRRHYRLVLLTNDEARALNRRNRTKMEQDRLFGIKMVDRGSHKGSSLERR
jgi:hypothetical protein